MEMYTLLYIKWITNKDLLYSTWNSAQWACHLTILGQRTDSYICARKGGTCNLAPCPLYNRIEGTCYKGKAKCCIR
ncbi:hypothetical protein FD754_013120 [Muntiacus muntjak]|uniref:Beta-defensin 1 n=1 Tax=Muntiacus muntjak TaxID=9888 RepID=A0A5N3VGY0_MUNMU|nr:hypothetical protein FD754_013120 [Muntiacus muntjak]